jgi:head-tail adaptor
MQDRRKNQSTEALRNGGTKARSNAGTEFLNSGAEMVYAQSRISMRGGRQGERSWTCRWEAQAGFAEKAAPHADRQPRRMMPKTS